MKELTVDRFLLELVGFRNQNTTFGDVEIEELFFTTAALDNQEQPRLFARSSSQPHFCQELYVHHFRPARGGEWLLTIVELNAPPQFCKLTRINDWISFKDELYIQSTRIQMWSDDVRALTPAERYHLAQHLPS